MTTFEGCCLGDGEMIGAATRLECGVCWTLYDPAVGDPIWQIPPGTPFSALPAHWTCPNCSAEKSRFMVVADD